MKAIHIALLALAATTATAQTSVTFKPGAAVGEDAFVWGLDNTTCIPNGYTTTPASQNFGNSPECSITKWTWGSCSTGTTRTYIRFTQLSTIPTNATITSAKLRLYTPSLLPNQQAGNNYYPGTPMPNTNPGWVKRVLPGNGNVNSPNNWKEQTITWNSAQSIGTDPTNANWATIPVTGAQYNWTVPAIDVRAMVQAIVSGLATDPYANNGFMLQLQTEMHYRSQLYASSDAADNSIWPALEVTYEVCDAGFSYCANSMNPYIYTLTANNPNQGTYNWSIQGNPGGNTPSVNTPLLSPPSIPVCLNVTTPSGMGKCAKCIYICPGDNPTFGTPSSGDFTYCSSTATPYSYSFAAVPGQSSYSWSLNGTQIATTPTLNHTFPTGPSGNYICLKTTNSLGQTTDRCVQFCMGQNRPAGPGAPATGVSETATGSSIVTLSPNPTKDGWNIRLSAAARGAIAINVYDVTGKLLRNTTQAVKEGDQTIYQDARALPAGMYYLSVTGAGLNAKVKAVKE